MSWSGEIGVHEYVAIAFHCHHCGIDSEPIDSPAAADERVRDHIARHDYAWAQFVVLDLRDLTAVQQRAVDADAKLRASARRVR